MELHVRQHYENQYSLNVTAPTTVYRLLEYKAATARNLNEYRSAAP
jgi:hypothetical protein